MPSRRLVIQRNTAEDYQSLWNYSFLFFFFFASIYKKAVKMGPKVWAAEVVFLDWVSHLH